MPKGRKKATPPAEDFIAPADREPIVVSAQSSMAEVITPQGTVAGTFTFDVHGDRFRELAAEYADSKGEGYTVR